MKIVSDKFIGNATIVMIAVMFLLMGLVTYPVFVGTVLFQSRLTGNEVRVAVPDQGDAAQQFKTSIEKQLVVLCRDEDEMHAVIELIKARRKSEMLASPSESK